MPKKIMSPSLSENKKFILSKRIFYHSIAFFIPVLVMLFLYKSKNVMPFGDSSILAMDLHGQYFPMLANYIETFFKGGLLYSWNGSLGFNALAQNAYYATSPLNLLMLFFSRTDWVTVIDLLPVLRMGLASLAFSFLLRYKFKDCNAVSALFSAVYGLSIYFIAYNSQLMWQDAIALTPILIIGLDRLIFEKKILLYCATLFLIMFSNFYIGYAVCLFTGIFFVFEILVVIHRGNIKDCLKTTGIFASASAASAALAGFVLIPVYKAISLAISSSMSFGNQLKTYHKLFEIVDSLTPGTKIEVEYGVPNIFCGILVLLLLVTYVFNKAIPREKRVLFTSFFCFMLYSFNFNLLDYIWHGFHFPNQLPGRQSFLFIFLVTYMAYETLRNIKHVPYYAPVTAGAIFASLFLYMRSDSKIPDLRVSAVYIAAAYALILMVLSFKKLKPYLRTGITIIISCGLLFEVAFTDYGNFTKYVRTTDAKAYFNNEEKIMALFEKYSSGAEDFSRTELSYHITFDPGQRFSFKGISHYSSTMPANTYNVLGNLGLERYAKNVSRLYEGMSPFLNNMLSVKYVFDNTNNFTMPNYELLEKGVLGNVYENKDWLPLAFMADDRLNEWKTNDELGSFIETQNDFFVLAANSANDIMTPLSWSHVKSENSTFKKQSDGTNTMSANDTSSPSSQFFTAKADKTGILYISIFQSTGSISVTVDGQQPKTASINGYGGYICVPVNENSEIEFTTKINKPSKSNYQKLFMGIIDEAEYSKAIETLKPGGIDITSFKNTKIKGTITAKENQIMFTSIPDDGGWSIYCDGEKLTCENIGELFLSAKLPAGTHEIEFRYSVPGLNIGILLSLSGLIVLVLLYLYTKKRSFAPLEYDLKLASDDNSDPSSQEKT